MKSTGRRKTSIALAQFFSCYSGNARYVDLHHDYTCQPIFIGTMYCLLRGQGQNTTLYITRGEVFI